MQKVYYKKPPPAPLFHALLQRALGILLPPHCLICSQRATVGALCHHCHAMLDESRSDHLDYCLHCAVALTHDTAHRGALQCGDCLQRPPKFDRCIAATRYTPLSAQLVNRLKHRGQLANAGTMAEWMHQAILRRHAPQPAPPPVDLALPIPLHPHRLRQRGFNQAGEIAKPLCRALGVTLSLDSCRRTVDSPPQQGLDTTARQRNLRHAFAASEAVAGKRIAVIDDVVTTTATANAVAASLLTAGARYCEIWCFARTPAP